MVHTPKYNGEFVVCVEDVFEIYVLLCDSEISLICVGEKFFYFVVGEVDLIDMLVNRPRLEGYLYGCVGFCGVFMFVVSFRGWRCVEA
jgi:hypothetical protein